ncbi:alpha/beta fold hydrolase [Oscillatoria sp. CS-180]|uniref:alpha/beta hydrolase n=1 Tax=Oscillatoria sp. CS-180 TaxID=3021720 RepID=UPI00232C2AA4|nr:alpha/beta fold hydrolase [Oscillatoria sp. CS-180]MDB9525679.1 alpha/beta fold hydrolase [Oscillatoria sp. CS-180]
MIRSRSKTRLVLLQIGFFAWGILTLGVIVFLLLQPQARFSMSRLPLVTIALWLGGTGAIAFFLAGLLSRKSRTYILFCISVLLVLLNGLAFFGAYTLTHFNDSLLPGLAFAPKPENARKPADFGLDYATERIAINEDEWLEAWRIPVYGESKGTVLLFPGNGGNKAHQLMLPASVFNQLGYHTLMVDFRGQGGSSGNSTTIGMREAHDVAYAMQHAEDIGLPKPYVLYGVSAGSAAILKAVRDGLQPDATILEAPFAYFMSAVKSRMRAQDFPTLGIAELIVFWGSVQHGYNGFVHNPARYAKSVEVPTLILHGEDDRWTTVDEIRTIYENLQGTKELALFPDTGHSLLVTVDKSFWTKAINDFLTSQL